jgi:hypothetical protein
VGVEAMNPHLFFPLKLSIAGDEDAHGHFVFKAKPGFDIF